MSADVPRYAIRNMDWDDLPRLAGLDRDSIHPWTYQQFADTIESRYVIGVVATAHNELAGCLIYVVSDTTPRVARKRQRLHLTVKVLKVAAAQPWRERGCTDYLVDTVEDGLLRQYARRMPAGRITMKITVPEHDVCCQVWLRNAGFLVETIKKKEFDWTDDDAYFFERKREWPVEENPQQQQELSPPSAAA